MGGSKLLESTFRSIKRVVDVVIEYHTWTLFSCELCEQRALRINDHHCCLRIFYYEVINPKQSNICWHPNEVGLFCAVLGNL